MSVAPLFRMLELHEAVERERLDPGGRLLALDQRHFELAGHEEFVRINLLNELALEGLQALAER
ncbi:hypothetical protein [Kitasatospora sp. NPDC056531]|uniref:hypothetical protein n=1 Tax=Kitasatospora sp. NPDC056531 TaxID=3345856 RepID=UPI0036AB62FF